MVPSLLKFLLIISDQIILLFQVQITMLVWILMELMNHLELSRAPPAPTNMNFDEKPSGMKTQVLTCCHPMILILLKVGYYLVTPTP